MLKNYKDELLLKSLVSEQSDHKEVEKELAKRSHFCMQVI